MLEGGIPPRGKGDGGDARADRRAGARGRRPGDGGRLVHTAPPGALARQPRPAARPQALLPESTGTSPPAAVLALGRAALDAASADALGDASGADEPPVLTAVVAAVGE